MTKLKPSALNPSIFKSATEAGATLADNFPALQWQITNLADTEALARGLAVGLCAGGVVYLSGDLGAGKTTFTAKLAKALGIDDAVKSPTYTIVESYALAAAESAPATQLHHLDLYRLTDPEELLYLALEDIVGRHDICMVEWPERGADQVLPADIRIDIRHGDDEDARQMQATAISARGRDIVVAWADTVSQQQK